MRIIIRAMKDKKLFRHLLSLPFIWSQILPVVIIHLALSIYQEVCFRLYGIERVQLRTYVNFDREKLSYLNFFDKLNCAYCTYANGVFAYVSEIGRRTEYYWCGIKHRNQPHNPAFFYQDKFATYGSKKEYDEVLIKSGRRSRK